MCLSQPSSKRELSHIVDVWMSTADLVKVTAWHACGLVMISTLSMRFRIRLSNLYSAVGCSRIGASFEFDSQ